MAAPRSIATVQEMAAERLLIRNRVSRAFFSREAPRLAEACREMADRFARGGRLLAFGHGVCATDAQHVSVEFVHPVIVGKRALPALDLSAAFEVWVPALVQPDDMVMGFSPSGGDPRVEAVLREAHARGAQTFALPGSSGTYAVRPPDADAFIGQELIEILYHTLWETVHVYLEHQPGGDADVGASGFLYPFLTDAPQDTRAVVSEVESSIRAKAASCELLRETVAREQAPAIAAAAAAMAARTAAGGTLMFFGNGGSATDANDWALDCAAAGIPALSLSMEPATLTAVANDIGREEIFLRQLIAQSRPGDVAVAISTSGGSANVIAALAEARRRGLLTIGLLGYDGGEIARRGLTDHAVVVACDYIPRIQEVQASIYHVIVEMLPMLLGHAPE
jgi:D-sedoheptulose 7-phosphate isomerase